MSFEFGPELYQASLETLQMLSIGLSAALVFGGALGILLYLWRPDGLRPNRFLAFTVGGLINVIRSFPFVILLISIGPLTRAITGTTIGPVAASVPLAIAAIAYFARLVELALNEVPRGIIEAAVGMGASTPRIVFSVLIVEAKSALILGFTTLAVSFVSYSAAAGIVGGGGIGDLAIRYGYYRFQTDVMVVTVAGLILIVQLIQFTGNRVAARYNRK
ncbi:MAG: ABC transporter permease [Bdellovibrionaceae bacterium]|nr:ABC transporter permease [Pseudobdellovibrionaceae bacterium]